MRISPFRGAHTARVERLPENLGGRFRCRLRRNIGLSYGVCKARTLARFHPMNEQQEAPSYMAFEAELAAATERIKVLELKTRIDEEVAIVKAEISDAKRAAFLKQTYMDAQAWEAINEEERRLKVLSQLAQLKLTEMKVAFNAQKKAEWEARRSEDRDAIQRLQGAR